MIVILKGDDVSKTAIAEIEEAKKRVESIERVSETLKSLSKEDLIAQTLLDLETYEEAYKPLLEEIKERETAPSPKPRETPP